LLVSFDRCQDVVGVTGRASSVPLIKVVRRAFLWSLRIGVGEFGPAHEHLGSQGADGAKLVIRAGCDLAPRRFADVHAASVRALRLPKAIWDLATGEPINPSALSALPTAATCFALRWLHCGSVAVIDAGLCSSL
jgi:hypothetical protein